MGWQYCMLPFIYHSILNWNIPGRKLSFFFAVKLDASATVKMGRDIGEKRVKYKWKRDEKNAIKPANVLIRFHSICECQMPAHVPHATYCYGFSILAPFQTVFENVFYLALVCVHDEGSSLRVFLCVRLCVRFYSMFCHSLSTMNKMIMWIKSTHNL